MKKVLDFMRSGFKKSKRAALGLAAAATLGGLVSQPASAANTEINPNATTESVVGGILEVIFKVSFWVGCVIAVIGVVSFILAFKDDNAESQSRGIRLAIVGTALIGIRFLIKLTGLIK